MRTLVLFLCAASASEQTAAVPISVWYGGGKARAPLLEANPRERIDVWRQDLRQIKSIGFHTIRAWIDWASGEPAEGRYDYFTLDVVLDLAGKDDLKVLYRSAWTPRRRGWAASTPARSTFPPASRLFVPKARPAIAATTRASAARRRACHGWGLWSQPHAINWTTPTSISNPEFCFCANTLARFRTRLRQKYGTLDALNEAWYRRFLMWDEVEHNRLSTILSFTDFIDWKTFTVVTFPSYSLVVPVRVASNLSPRLRLPNERP